MVHLPCGEICAEVRLHIGFVVLSRIRVQHRLFLRIYEKFIAGLWGGVCLNGFLNLEWLFVLLLVESTRNAASFQIGSTGKD